MLKSRCSRASASVVWDEGPSHGGSPKPVGRSELVAGPVELPDLEERDFGTTAVARARDTDVQSDVFKLAEP